ncbi:MerR family transcriptional regulator [Niabella hibiscisoli]|uniref:hypothetical protein n=1 Tax=Niabella hibiscisoli TaxID=1825928 RepID=UPI00374DCA04
MLRPPAQIEAIEEEVMQPENVDAAPVSVEPQVDLVEDASVLEEDNAIEIESEIHFEEEEAAAIDFSREALEEEIIEERTSNDPIHEAAQERRSSRGRKSVKEHSIAAEMIEMPGDDVLYAKQYYSMGEVTSMFKENHSLIRYWESEFDILRPKKMVRVTVFSDPWM